MPIVNIQLVRDGIADDPEGKKARIAEQVAAVVSEVAGLPKSSVWVVFEEVAAKDWFIGDESVAEMRRKRGL
jgi:4-oxalocrotonate tautomerase